MTDTIAALASGRGRAGVAVIRVSGPDALAALAALAGTVPPPRLAKRAALRGAAGELLDQALILAFPAPASFTGEDVAELHLHGGPAVVAGVLAALTARASLRLAEPGEFTRRAVAHGKLDLTEAEGIAALVEAETAGQRRQALAQAGGALAQAAGRWRSELIGLSALAEAEIDFPDEGDVPVLMGRVRAGAARLLAEADAALAAARRGERLREGAVIVIAGPPNAGKSTLLNALARREVAIVSPVPGTTRDAIEVHLDLGGHPATLIDTAGLRETDDPVEAIGVARARQRAGTADLVLWLSPADAPAPAPDFFAAVLVCVTKADLVAHPPAQDGLRLSVPTGDGLDALLDRLAAAVADTLSGGESALVTRERHRVEIGAMAASLRRVAEAPEETPAEFVAEDLRLALRALGRLTGRVDIDEMFDAIFGQFCIGK